MALNNNNIRGLVEASISAIAFGTIPLFSIPVLNEGIDSLSLLVYRFAFACVIILLVLIANKRSMHINRGDAFRIMFISLLYAVSAISLIEGYKYMSSGIATTLLFSYPIWTALLMGIFFKERLKFGSIISIFLAIGGVVLLSGVIGGDFQASYKGLLCELFSGFLYATYMVILPVMRIRKMSSLKLTFYVFFFTMLLISFYSLFVTGGIKGIPSTSSFINLALLGLVPTAISNITLIMALKKVSSTMAAILGAFEPVTAMFVGVLVFSEPFTMPIALGLLLIIASVIFLVLSNKKAQEQDKQIEEEKY